MKFVTHWLVAERDINNHEKVSRSPHWYQSDREKNIQYSNEITIYLVKQKNNIDISYWEFPIKIYIRELLYKPFFITTIIYKTLIMNQQRN